MDSQVTSTVISVIGAIAGIWLTNYLSKPKTVDNQQPPSRDSKINPPKANANISINQNSAKREGIIWRVLFDDDVLKKHKVFFANYAHIFAWVGPFISALLTITIFFVLAASQDGNEESSSGFAFRFFSLLSLSASVVMSFGYFIVTKANIKYRNIFPILLSVPFLLYWLSACVLLLIGFFYGSFD